MGLARPRPRTGHYLRLSYERGSRLSLNAGASALVLLAWLPEDHVRKIIAGVDLHRYTENTLADPDLIVERLKSIRADGFCVAYGQVDPDVLGIAVPIFGSEGDVCATLSLVTLRSRLTPQAVKAATASLAQVPGVLQAR